MLRILIEIPEGTRFGKATIVNGGDRNPTDEPPAEGRVLASGGVVVDVGGEQGPYSGTGRDTSILPMSRLGVEVLPPATSVNRRTEVGSVVAFVLDLHPGPFRAGLGEYGDAGAFSGEMALSRTLFEIEGAPARGTNQITGITIGDDPSQVFGPGKWYLNVRVNAAGAEGKTSQAWTVSYYQ